MRFHLVARAFAAFLGLSAALLGCAATATAQCLGDCDGDGAVSVDELVRGVNIALGVVSVASCRALDGDGSDTVTIDEVITAVNKALLGCHSGAATPTRTATPTASATPAGQATATATAVVAPGCDRGLVTGSFSMLVDTNVEASPAELRLVAAAEVRDPRSGVYFWAINANTCADVGNLARSVQIQLIGVRSAFAAGSYALTPPLGTLIYVESPAIGGVQPRIWQSTGTTLVIDAVDGDRLTFHIDAAPMVPNTIVAGDPPPRGTFHLSVAGTVSGFTSD